MKQATAYISQDPAILKKVSISERLPDPGFLYHSASPLDKKANRLLKRSLDLAVSSALLFTVFIILLPVIALLIRLDSKGPIFFLQKTILLPVFHYLRAIGILSLHGFIGRTNQ